jgi:hypothetical protein
MSLATFMDHRCRVRKFNEVVTPTREQANSYSSAATSAEEPVGFTTMPAGRLNRGPGARPTGALIALLPTGASVNMNDVLEVFAGPDAPRQFRVIAEPTRPRNHHTEAPCEPVTGALPA